MSEMCGKGLHEMTPDNIYVSPGGRTFCRECQRDRAKLSRDRREQGFQPMRKGYHAEDAAYAEQARWDAVFEKEPAVIEWVPNGKGVWLPTVISDPHADKSDCPARREAQAAFYANRRAAS